MGKKAKTLALIYLNSLSLNYLLGELCIVTYELIHVKLLEMDLSGSRLKILAFFLICFLFTFIKGRFGQRIQLAR